MAVCISFNCKYFNKCARSAMNNEGVHTARPYAEQGLYDSNGNIIKWHCGERGDYESYKPIRKRRKKDV